MKVRTNQTRGIMAYTPVYQMRLIRGLLESNSPGAGNEEKAKKAKGLRRNNQIDYSGAAGRIV
jgi:hypothetical protein